MKIKTTMQKFGPTVSDSAMAEDPDPSLRTSSPQANSTKIIQIYEPYPLIY